MTLVCLLVCLCACVRMFACWPACRLFVVCLSVVNVFRVVHVHGLSACPRTACLCARARLVGWLASAHVHGLPVASFVNVFRVCVCACV